MKVKLFMMQLSVGVILATLFFNIFSHLEVSSTIDQSKQWTMEVYADQGLPYVDNIAYLSNGVILATLEIKKLGRVMAIHPKGKVTIIVDKLDRPDGLLVVKDYTPTGKVAAYYLYITQEMTKGSVIRYNVQTKQREELLKINNPEGIDQLPDGRIIVSEDLVHGNVYWIDKHNKAHILIANLFRPEGLCVAVDGSIYIAETGRNRIVRWFNGKLESVITGLREPDQVECHVDGSVWITEDAMPGRLMRYYQKKLYVIAKGLHKPQGIAFAPYGIVYVAEQGKHRIVKFKETLTR